MRTEHLLVLGLVLGLPANLPNDTKLDGTNLENASSNPSSNSQYPAGKDAVATHDEKEAGNQGTKPKDTPTPVESKPTEAKPEAVKPVEQKPNANDTQSKDIPTSVDSKPTEAKPEAVKPIELKPNENKPVGDNPTDSKPVEAKPEAKLTELKQTENKPVETKPEEAKIAELKPAENKPVDTKPEEVKVAELKPTDNKPVETKPEVKVVELKPVENKPEETKLAELKPSDNKPTEDGPVEIKPDEPSVVELESYGSYPVEPNPEYSNRESDDSGESKGYHGDYGTNLMIATYTPAIGDLLKKVIPFLFSEPRPDDSYIPSSNDYRDDYDQGGEDDENNDAIVPRLPILPVPEPRNFNPIQYILSHIPPTFTLYKPERDEQKYGKKSAENYNNIDYSNRESNSKEQAEDDAFRGNKFDIPADTFSFDPFGRILSNVKPAPPPSTPKLTNGDGNGPKYEDQHSGDDMYKDIDDLVKDQKNKLQPSDKLDNDPNNKIVVDGKELKGTVKQYAINILKQLDGSIQGLLYDYTKNYFGLKQ